MCMQQKKRTKKNNKIKRRLHSNIHYRKKFGNYLIEKYLREKKQHLSIV